MAKRCIIWIVLIAAFLALPAACSGPGGGDVPEADFPATLGGPRQVQYELGTDFPTVPGTIKTYKVRSADITAESAAEIGRKFGFTGKARLNESSRYKISDYFAMGDNVTNERLHVQTHSGAIWYSYHSKLYPQEFEDIPSLPSYEEAEKIAVDFLSQRGLLPPDVRFNKVGVGNSMGDIRGEFATALLVSFRRYIDGIPVTGVGAKYGVRIVENGEVAEVFRSHRKVEPCGEVAIRPPAEAYQDLKDGKGRGGMPSSRAVTVVIDEVTLAYWMDSVLVMQELVVPVYRFRGECFDESGSYVGDFNGCAQATAGDEVNGTPWKIIY